MTTFTSRSLGAMLALLLFAVPATASLAAEAAVVIPAPSVDEAAKGNSETAVFAGGCFWGIQAVFQHVKGVKNAVSGYSGGAKETASYETVSLGQTGHAEAVEVTFDPNEVSYGTLLQIFFSVAHNPTQLDYQGPDQGTQYRSAIFAGSDDQRKVAAAYIAQLDKAGLFHAPIVTKLSKLDSFYPAEKYHQDFLTLNPDHPYIVYNDMPKIDNLKAIFPATFRANPVLVSKAKT
ncbi:peptide-methionine (S)-S-oxide reductase MsrA [Aliirhizobium smilacinae]|uniref:Peptide methionine sulfoxide reductase MsrA n=1 Tax=Aliirhizobium smilacinae TaxID=1395944 RepID=A0A5C4XAJ2_9HYPH|nr:peptide-methionine (S)-S-oxide reductase MsrA [Rhizobium smilacinae]TNM60515.1 peptide-methionine (S)-S-oxide reductase MsrA [Rhizobium smilacinae]